MEASQTFCPSFTSPSRAQYYCRFSNYLPNRNYFFRPENLGKLTFMPLLDFGILLPKKHPW